MRLSQKMMRTKLILRGPVPSSLTSSGLTYTNTHLFARVTYIPSPYTLRKLRSGLKGGFLHEGNVASEFTYWTTSNAGLCAGKDTSSLKRVNKGTILLEHLAP